MVLLPQIPGSVAEKEIAQALNQTGEKAFVVYVCEYEVEMVDLRQITKVEGVQKGL